MIVVDTNIIAYLYLPNEHSLAVETLLRKNPHWVAPSLWRSELRNVLALYLRKKILTFEQAYDIQTEAEALLTDREYNVSSYDVLSIAHTSHCSAYDCEFISLAQKLNTSLVTSDKKVLQTFPTIAISLQTALMQFP